MRLALKMKMNTLPGLTETSLPSKSAKYDGIKFLKLIEIYRFDLSFPILLCLKTPVLPATAGIVSTHRFDSRDSRFRGNDGLCGNDKRNGNDEVNENENRKSALKKQELSNQTGMILSLTETDYLRR